MAKRFLKIRRSKPYQYLKDKFLYVRAYVRWKLNPYPKDIGDNPIFVFNHIPKCGGTSLNIVLRKWFILRKDYSPHELKFPDPEKLEIEFSKFENSPPKLSEIKPWEILGGHYHNSKLRLSKRFPEIYENPGLKLITFIREPLEHHLSMYKYGKKRGHDFVKNLSLSQYLENDCNFLAGALECNLENYKSRIDEYFFIGTLEEFQYSMERLARKLGKTELETIPFENQTNSKTLFNSLSEDEIIKFKKNNILDYLIYEYVKNSSN
ncbi:sulfotransferase family 2 domain-containing protein [Algoriphagus sp. PAP.12]|uniref:sulfotransferase family 2 domain-containing protein n=1 Tax=Algoriphagus sp. PAP.12 TaxID=2996678 RepID=UPI00227D5917|nr:sulfotransferase family 2 domain-containing protein [Algoriphagus sp. PAP.12]